MTADFFFTGLGGREVADLFRNTIGTSTLYILCTRLHALTCTGQIRNVHFCENGTSMEITFFNPDDAMCVLSLFRLHYQTSPAQKFSLHVRIHDLRTAYVSFVHLDTFNFSL